MPLSQSAYPVIVLEALQCGHRAFEDIQNYGYEKYGIKISVRTIRRHVKLVKSLTYTIPNDPELPIASPASLERITFNIDTTVSFGSAAYPLMILTVLKLRGWAQKQKNLIHAIKFAFNDTYIERKALSRNIQLLISMGYNIQHTKYGYRLLKD